MSFDKLQEKILALSSPCVVGLDPKPEYIPPELMSRHIKEHGETLKAAAAAYSEFSRGIIDAVAGIVPAVKPQAAYFEALGPDGFAALKDACDYAKAHGLYVVMDAKRGDIGTTAQAYSQAYLGRIRIGSTELRPFDCDAVTVNTYLGSDGLLPFLETAEKEDKAFFALLKTSNPSSGELQDLTVEDGHIYERVGMLIHALAKDTHGSFGYTRIGAVVGATYPEELTALRKKLSDVFFLVPGYGAQGGTGDDVVGAFDERGCGAIVNSSRGIICAWKKNGGDYIEEAHKAAVKMRDELKRAAGL